ncbi:MAG: ribosome biogenesis GTPase YlqF [Eubacteriales bacterium]|nr:ribosome biogenesis GTPase YlqF [Eubacteriales bacterium]
MEGQRPISWYPGHMAKAKRLLEGQLKRVDIVLELCDARLPLSSRNPALDSMAAHKPRLLLLNKEDLADPAATRQWVEYFRAQGVEAYPVQAGKHRQKILKLVDDLTREKRERAQARGISAGSRAMVVGVPNVGKSTLINALAGRSALKTQDRPGVTRAPQWMKAGERLEMLDTPGMLWPKLDDQKAARRLAYIAAIRDEVLNSYHLAISLLDELMANAPEKVAARYKIEDQSLRGQGLMEAICRSRGFLQKGNEYDLDRGAACVLDEFRGGLIGRITLELPGDVS